MGPPLALWKPRGPSAPTSAQGTSCQSGVSPATLRFFLLGKQPFTWVGTPVRVPSTLWPTGPLTVTCCSRFIHHSTNTSCKASESRGWDVHSVPAVTEHHSTSVSRVTPQSASSRAGSYPAEGGPFPCVTLPSGGLARFISSLCLLPGHLKQ